MCVHNKCCGLYEFLQSSCHFFIVCLIILFLADRRNVDWSKKSTQSLKNDAPL